MLTREEAVKKAATALGFWIDTDGQMYMVDEDGQPMPSLQMASEDKLRRAQAYIVHLLQKFESGTVAA